MKNLKRILFVQGAIILLLLLTSCSASDPIEFKKVNSFKIEQGNRNGTRIKTNVTLYNPNTYGCKVHNADIYVSVDNVKVGKLNIPKTVKIKPKNEFSGDCYIDIDFSKALMLGATVIPKMRRGEVKVHFTGTAKASFMLITKNIKIDKVEKISLNSMSKNW